MPVYKDKERDTWFCKFNYKDWRGETKTKLKRGFRTKKEAQEWEREFLQVQQADMDMEFGKFVDVYFADKATSINGTIKMYKKSKIKMYNGYTVTMEVDSMILKSNIRKIL